MNKKSNIFNEPDFPESRGLRRGTTGQELLIIMYNIKLMILDLEMIFKNWSSQDPANSEKNLTSITIGFIILNRCSVK